LHYNVLFNLIEVFKERLEKIKILLTDDNSITTKYREGTVLDYKSNRLIPEGTNN
jgi:hypothetical protein